MDGTSQRRQYNHRILTVGNIPAQSRDVGPILHNMDLEFIHLDTADQAVAALEKAPIPFALVICDQRLEGMKGTALMARAKKAAPETIRFLITRYSDIKTIISAVNTGAVHRYISMPWDETQMIQAIKWGLCNYERHLESEKLFSLAKTQNGKLYELNCELMETARHHRLESKKLEKEISGLKAELKEKTTRRPMTPKKLAALICHAAQEGNQDAGELIHAIYTQSIADLYSTFNDLAMRHGVELPEPVLEDLHD